MKSAEGSVSSGTKLNLGTKHNINQHVCREAVVNLDFFYIVPLLKIIMSVAIFMIVIFPWTLSFSFKK